MKKVVWLCVASALVLGAPVAAAPPPTTGVELIVELGRATDSDSSLSSPPSSHLQTAQMDVASPSTGSFVEVPPPAVADYWLTARRTAEGRVVLDGYVPSQSARDALTTDPAVDPSSLEFAGGEPKGFAVAVAFGLERLARMSEGRFSLRSNVLTLAGTASTPEDHAALSSASGVPAGYVLARNEIVPPADAPAAGPGEPQGETVTSMAEPAALIPADEMGAGRSLPVAEPYVWSADKTADGVVIIAGHLPGEPLRRILMIRAGEGAVDTTQLAAGAPDGFILDARAAMDLLAILAEGTVAYDGAQWSVAGTLADGRGQEALRAALAGAATDSAAWSLAVTQAEPPATPADLRQTVVGQGSPDARPQDAASPQPLGQCRAHLAAFSAQNAILFRSGSAAIAPSSEPVLAELAGYVEACPDLPIYIEGHTDADGAAEANLALSVARAEAVVAALVGLGIAPARLYAVGYGESAPVAPNDTPQGKQLNRRIVVSLDGPE